MIQENRQPTQRTDQRMVHTVEYCRDDPDNASPPRHGQHYHNGYEMIYIQSGEAEVTVDRSVYLAKAPCLLIISNLEEHQIRVMERPYVRYYTILTPKLTDRLIANPVLMSVFKNRAGGFRHVIPAEGLQDAAEAFFQGLISEEEEHGELQNELSACLLKALLIRLYRREKGLFSAARRTVRPEICQIQQYIEDNYAQDLKISQIADQFYINLYYLSHSFKEYTGYSPKQYLMLNRISGAKELLVATHLSVSQIAARCGFSDTNNFIRSFKSECGMTPRQYRTEQITSVQPSQHQDAEPI